MTRVSFLLPLLLLLNANNVPPIECASKILEIAKPAVDVVDGNTHHQQQQQEQSPVHNPICRLPKQRGIVCPSGANTTMGVKWFFDVETLECLSFGFNGCGGNANRFDSIFECRQECQLPADYGGCSGRRSGARNAQGETIVCAGPEGQQAQCPAGYRCQYMAFFGVCCHTQTEELYTRNYRPKCANGKASAQIQDTVNNWPIQMLGKSCSDEFCPVGTDCIGQEIFAHCCPK